MTTERLSKDSNIENDRINNDRIDKAIDSSHET